MEIVQSYFKDEFQNFLGTLMSAPFVFSNHILQALFFTMSVTELISAFLQFIKFSYYEQVSNMRIFKIMATILFFYLKIWDHYSNFMYFLSIFASLVLCFYIYDCNCNISEGSKTQGSFQQYSLLLVFCLSVGLNGLFVYKWKIGEQGFEYEYMQMYGIMMAMIFVSVLVRRRSPFYACILTLTTALIVVGRVYSKNLVKDSMMSTVSLPFEALIYVPMAFDAERKEREAMKSHKYKHLFRATACFFVYHLLNRPNFQIQLILGGVAIALILLNK